jgi:hypothetical protein
VSRDAVLNALKPLQGGAGTSSAQLAAAWCGPSLDLFPFVGTKDWHADQAVGNSLQDVADCFANTLAGGADLSALRDQDQRSRAAGALRGLVHAALAARQQLQGVDAFAALREAFDGFHAAWSFTQHALNDVRPSAHSGTAVRKSAALLDAFLRELPAPRPESVHQATFLSLRCALDAAFGETPPAPPLTGGRPWPRNAFRIVGADPARPDEPGTVREMFCQAFVADDFGLTLDPVTLGATVVMAETVASLDAVRNLAHGELRKHGLALRIGQGPASRPALWPALDGDSAGGMFVVAAVAAAPASAGALRKRLDTQHRGAPRRQDGGARGWRKSQPEGHYRSFSKVLTVGSIASAHTR